MVNKKRRSWKSEKSLERNKKNEIGTGSSKKFKMQQRIFHFIQDFNEMISYPTIIDIRSFQKIHFRDTDKLNIKSHLILIF